MVARPRCKPSADSWTARHRRGSSSKGPAGIGKTTVWRAGIEHARGAGHRVLVTRPSEVETAPAIAGLMDLLGEVFDQHGAVLPAPQRSALAVALLRESADQADVEPGAVSAAALGLVRHAAEERPVLFAIDDRQWLDAATTATPRFGGAFVGSWPHACGSKVAS